jgi:hypothetical protein
MTTIREIPITGLVVNDQGTPDTSDDTYTEQIIGYRLEVYEDGVDLEDPNARPIEVVRSTDNLVSEDDLPLATERLDERPPLELDPEIVDRILAGEIDAPLVEALLAVPPEVLTALFESLLAEAYPGSPSILAAIEAGKIDPAVLEGMPGRVASGLTDAILRAEPNQAMVLEAVLSLLGPASLRDPSVTVPSDDRTQDDAARAAAALFGIAFTHLDQDPDGWEAATGFAFLGDSGGNCATFTGVALLYAGFAESGNFRVYEGSDPPILGNGIRGAVGIQQYFAGENGAMTDPASLRVGDLITTTGDLPDAEDAHVSMVIGFGDPSADPPRIFPTYAEAVAFYGEGRVQPFVVDHDPSNPGTTAWPGIGIQPASQVHSGGETSYGVVTP